MIVIEIAQGQPIAGCEQASRMQGSGNPKDPAMSVRATPLNPLSAKALARCHQRAWVL